MYRSHSGLRVGRKVCHEPHAWKALQSLGFVTGKILNRHLRGACSKFEGMVASLTNPSRDSVPNYMHISLYLAHGQHLPNGLWQISAALPTTSLAEYTQNASHGQGATDRLSVSQSNLRGSDTRDDADAGGKDQSDAAAMIINDGGGVGCAVDCCGINRGCWCRRR